MFHRQRGQRNNRVTPSFIRNVRKGCLDITGRPLPGKERDSDTLLHVLRAVQSGEYLRGLALAKRNGIDLERMYRDYHRLVLSSRRGLGDLTEGVQSFCDKHNIHIRVRVSA